MTTVIGTQGPERWLLSEGVTRPQATDPVVVVDLHQKKAWRMAAGSVLARGYWREPTGPTPDPDDLLADLTVTDVTA